MGAPGLLGGGCTRSQSYWGRSKESVRRVRVNLREEASGSDLAFRSWASWAATLADILEEEEKEEEQYRSDSEEIIWR